MKLKQLLYVLDCANITICYAGFGERIYKGSISGNIPKHALEYYITLITPINHDNIYVEVHENEHFIVRGEE